MNLQYQIAVAITDVSDVMGKKFVAGARLVILATKPDKDGKILCSAFGRYLHQANIPFSLLKVEP